MLQSKISFSYLNCASSFLFWFFFFFLWFNFQSMDLWARNAVTLGVMFLCVIILLLSSWSLSLLLLSPILEGILLICSFPLAGRMQFKEKHEKQRKAAFFRLFLSIPPVCLRMGLGASRAGQRGAATPHHPTAYFQAVCSALPGQSENGRGWQAKAWGKWLTGLFSAFQI